jgi:hypothetical protein
MNAASSVISLAYLVGVFISRAVYSRRAGLTEIKHKQGVTWQGFLLRKPLFFFIM